MVARGKEVDALLRGTRLNVVPLYDSPWGDTLAKWVTQGYPVDAAGSAIDPIEHFGFDMATVGGWFDWISKRGPQEIIAETDEWKIVRNGNGAELKWWKHRSGTPEHIRFAMSSRAIWERDYRPHLTQFDPTRVDLAGARAKLAHHRAAGRWTFYGQQGVWECLRASLGDENMFMALADDPEWIKDFNRVHTDLYKNAFRLLLEQAGRPDGIWLYDDLGYCNRLFCRKEVLAELIFPYYTELVDFFRGYDLPVVFHSCGFQAPMIPLAIEAGFAALNPMEVKAGNDILAYAEQYGDRLAFVGGFDARVLEQGDRALIRKTVTAHIRGLQARGARFLFGSDHSISTNVDYASFQYAIEVYRELTS